MDLRELERRFAAFVDAKGDGPTVTYGEIVLAALLAVRRELRETTDSACNCGNKDDGLCGDASSLERMVDAHADTIERQREELTALRRVVEAAREVCDRWVIPAMRTGLDTALAASDDLKKGTNVLKSGSDEAGE